MGSEHDAILAERRLLKERYGELFDSVTAVLFDADPIGINFGSNTDEYEPEVGTILPRLKEAYSSNDVARIIHEEFCRWFDKEDVGAQDEYSAIANSVWKLWYEFNESHT